MVFGGVDEGGNQVLETEVFDPKMETWNAADRFPLAHGVSASVVLLDGRVLVADQLADLSRTDQSLLSLYDPKLNQWQPGPFCPVNRVDGLVILKDNRVFVHGASGDSGIYDPLTKRWVLTGAGDHSFAPAYACFCLLDGRVVVFCNSRTQSICIFDPRSVSWTIVPRGTPLPDLFIALKSSSVFGLNTGTMRVSLFDPKNGLWRECGYSAVLGCRDGSDTMVDLQGSRLLSGRIALIGGQKTVWEPFSIGFPPWGHLIDWWGAVRGAEGLEPVPDCNIFDPATESWAMAAQLCTARAECSVTLLQDGRVLVTGGVDSKQKPLKSCEIGTLE